MSLKNYINKTTKCECGCGKTTTQWPQSYVSKNVKKGDYRRFIKGHYNKIKQYAKCHPTRLIKAKGLCASCYNKLILDKHPHLREQANARRRTKHKKDAETRNPIIHAEKQRIRRLKHRHGLTAQNYDDMLKEQKGCALCGIKTNKNGKALFVDHDHTTNKVRALLCARCNTMVGIIETQPNFIKKAVAYINKYK